MKKLKLIYCFILCFLFCGIFTCFGPPVNASTNLPSQVTVTLQTAVYTQPSLTSPIHTKDNTAILLDVGTKLKVDTTFKHDMFYKVDIYQIIEHANDGDFGYVLISHTLDSQIKSPLKKLDANAKVKNDSSQIYSFNYTSQSYEPIQNLTLNKNTQVRILDGYDKKKEFTYISFLNSNQELVSYYIQTSNLEVFGVNYSVIVAIMILIACVGIVGAVFGVNIKKKKATK